MYRYTILIGLVGVLAVGAAAQDKTKVAAEGAPLKVTVVSVSGAAEKRDGSDPKAKWAPLKAGDVLGERMTIRTGLGAKVVLRLADGGEMTIRNVAKVDIGELRRTGKLVKTRLGLKYGSMRSAVDSSRGPNDFKVATPVSTLSVRGSDAAKVAAEGAPLKVTVVSVSGVAEKRVGSDPKAKWVPLKAGDMLGERMIIRTGLGAKVVLRFADRGETTIRNVAKVGIGEFRKTGKLVKTRLGLKYGSMRSAVDSSRGPNDFKVAMPVATLSVRGSGAAYGSSGDFGPGVKVFESTWQGQAGGKQMNVGPGQSTDGDLTRSILLAMLAKFLQIGDPNGGQTNGDALNYLYNGQGRGVFDFVGGGGGSTQFFAIGSHNGNGQGPVDVPIPVYDDPCECKGTRVPIVTTPLTGG